MPRPVPLRPRSPASLPVPDACGSAPSAPCGGAPCPQAWRVTDHEVRGSPGHRQGRRSAHGAGGWAGAGRELLCPVPSPLGSQVRTGTRLRAGGRAASRLCLHVSFHGKCLVPCLGLWPGRVWLVSRLFNCEAHALISQLARRGPWPPPGRWNGTGRGGHEGGGPRAGPQPVTSWREALGPLPPSPASHGPLFPLCFLKPHRPFRCQVPQDFPADPSSPVWSLGHWIWRVRNPRSCGSHIFAHPAPTRPDRLGRVSASALSLGRPHLGEHPPPPTRSPASSPSGPICGRGGAGRGGQWHPYPLHLEPPSTESSPPGPSGRTGGMVPTVSTDLAKQDARSPWTRRAWLCWTGFSFRWNGKDDVRLN